MNTDYKIPGSKTICFKYFNESQTMNMKVTYNFILPDTSNKLQLSYTLNAAYLSLP